MQRRNLASPQQIMDITLNRTDKLALYRQIAEQIRTHIGNGRLPAGTRLPTVRQLAKQLGVTRLTIQNAYGELQADGWLEATVGRGTFVSQAVRPHTPPETAGGFHSPDSALRDMIYLSDMVGVRSMAIAHPDSTLFPIDAYWQYLEKLRPEAIRLMQYGPIQGDTLLRAILAEQYVESGINTLPDNLFITTGVMQGLSLVSQALAQPGDRVLVDKPTFLGTLNMLRAQRLIAVSVALDEEGPDLAQVEQIVQQHRPKFYYAIPNYQNPTGICMSLARRHALVELAEKYDFWLVEDDIYGRLAYDSPPPPTLRTLSAKRTIYLDGFSKALMPGLRVGVIIAPQHLNQQLNQLRRATDMCGPTIMQRALALFLRDGGLKRHLRRAIPHYRQHRDTLINALRRYLPSDARWHHPAGGFCCWVTLPRRHPKGELYRLALQRGFAFTPGEAYETEDVSMEQFRLCFGEQSTTAIEDSVRLLGDLLHLPPGALQNGRSSLLPIV